MAEMSIEEFDMSSPKGTASKRQVLRLLGIVEKRLDAIYDRDAYYWWHELCLMAKKYLEETIPSGALSSWDEDDTVRLTMLHVMAEFQVHPDA